MTWKSGKNLKNIGIVQSDNLEVVLTLPDLLSAAKKEYDCKTYEIQNADEYVRRAISKERTELQNAKDISEIFIDLLEKFFLSLSSNGYNPPQYYKDMLDGFDNIITTNWDGLSECTLFVCKQWRPFDGYGIELPEEKKESSKKMIYKLHGSIGWRIDNSSGDFFLHDQFKNILGIGCLPSSNTPLKRNWPGHSEKILITPSYLKPLTDQYLIEIWKKAQHAIYSSSEIYIVGYSLPNADVAIRALLLSAIGKKIKIIDPCNPCNKKKETWDRFLGQDQYEFIEKNAKDYFSS